MFKPFLSATLSLLATASIAFTAAKAGELPALEKVYVADVAISAELADRKVSSIAYRSTSKRAVDAKDLERKAADLKEELEATLGKTKTLVSEPGPDVLTVQATILDLRSSRPTMADYRAEPGLSHRSIYAGGAEVEIILSVDGNEVGRLSDDYYGSLADGLPEYSTWGDADRAFYRFARKLAKEV